MISSDAALAVRWAGFYRARGFAPLPSRRDAKRPMVRFAEYWNSPPPADLFDRMPTSNIQLILGRFFRLLVIDLDGPQARTRFDCMAEIARGKVPPTWITHSGGNGLHLWFRLPTGFAAELPRAVLWKGQGEHEAIERLCDRSLIVAPPSIHPKTGKCYRFLDRSHSPVKIPMPADCPAWVLALKPIEPSKPAPVSVPTVTRKPATAVAHGRYRAEDVLEAITDKIGLAASWGLSVASGPNRAGWCQCHAVGRPDRNPSASISATSGRYWEPGTKSISLFDLAVQLGVYLTWQDAICDIAQRFRARECER